jgi:UDP-glucuronate decarboxylase
MHPNDGRVVSNFVVQALLGNETTIYGAGLQTRSFCYVDDLIDGLMRLMISASAVTGPINIGNPVEFTMLALAEMVIELTNSRSQLAFRPLPQDDSKRRRPDITQAMETLGWSPTTALKTGLVNTIRYFDDMLAKNSAIENR